MCVAGRGEANTRLAQSFRGRRHDQAHRRGSLAARCEFERRGIDAVDVVLAGSAVVLGATSAALWFRAESFEDAAANAASYPDASADLASAEGNLLAARITLGAAVAMSALTAIRYLFRGDVAVERRITAITGDDVAGVAWCSGF